MRAMAINMTDADTLAPSMRLTALHLAAEAGHASTVQVLLDAGAEVCTCATHLHGGVCHLARILMHTCILSRVSGVHHIVHGLHAAPPGDCER